MTLLHKLISSNNQLQYGGGSFNSDENGLNVSCFKYGHWPKSARVGGLVGIFSNLHHFRFSTEQQKINKQEEEVTVAALLKWPCILIIRCYYLRI